MGGEPFPSAQNIVGNCKEITILISYRVTSGLITLVKFIYASLSLRYF